MWKGWVSSKSLWPFPSLSCRRGHFLECIKSFWQSKSSFSLAKLILLQPHVVWHGMLMSFRTDTCVRYILSVGKEKVWLYPLYSCLCSMQEERDLRRATTGNCYHKNTPTNSTGGRVPAGWMDKGILKKTGCLRTSSWVLYLRCLYHFIPPFQECKWHKY